MSLHRADLPSLVIASGSTDSTTAITASLDDADALTIQAPAALTGTVKINVIPNGGTTYAELGSGGSDISIAAGDVVSITKVTFHSMKVTSGSTEAGTRTFRVAKTFVVS